MIEESVKNAEEGVSIADDVAKAFESIAGSNAKVDDLIAEIAAASQEQSQGIDQVNTAVAQMDKVTQQNAANSEESASAAEELSSQAEELQNMVAQFSLSGSGTGQKSAAAANGRPSTLQMKPVPERKTERRGKSNGENGRSSGGNGKPHAGKVELQHAAATAIPFDDDTLLREF